MCSLEAFTVEQIHRSKITDAPYNPRFISDKARIKLEGVLSKLGVVQPLVWNRKTGHLVSGHQRLRIMDDHMGTQDYSLTVAVVDANEVREKEINVALNASQITGEFDLDKLEEVLGTEGLDLEAAGFDANDMVYLFGTLPGASSSLDESDSGRELLDELEEIRNTYEQLDEAHILANETDFFAVLVCRTAEDRERLLHLLGIPDGKYVNGETLEKHIKALLQRAGMPAGGPLRLADLNPEQLEAPGAVVNPAVQHRVAEAPGEHA